MINASSFDVMSEVVFKVNPPNSGYIKCDDKDPMTGQYLLVKSFVNCKAESNEGFEFTSWYQDFGNNSDRIISISPKNDGFLDLYSIY
jgi:hypothetical protein